MARKHGAKIKNMKRTDPNRPIACRIYVSTNTILYCLKKTEVFANVIEDDHFTSFQLFDVTVANYI